jgi:hypothetical protein
MLVLHLREQLLQAYNGNIEGEELRAWLERLQEEFAMKMASIDAELDSLPVEPDLETETDTVVETETAAEIREEEEQGQEIDMELDSFEAVEDLEEDGDEVDLVLVGSE